ncbi:D-sedoheptulose-7-phosphate isomerase [Actinomadura xylanilytica]|uniref:D-sedoheptulose-7-phosphate isomerase n=1 Tax=Actinomadura xylanilytica TaxID=887459 RepID=UPI00255B00CD|nr:SIS domain-containing protein [Actinomadura xylanilytica]MDL4774314.1 SIS domain-containing protein [Actinomadura xylanilytica]
MTEQLYPFLRQDGAGTDTGTDEADAGALLEEVRRSTREKAHEIIALRRAVLDRDGDRLTGCAARLARAFASGGRLFVFGNGGSSTDAQDVAALFLNPGELEPGEPARPLPALALTTDAAVVTALSNDVGFEVVFARQLAAFGRPGDIALGLSTSGDSPNLIRAFEEAARRGMVTVGLAGSTGGAMAELGGGIDHLFVMPSASVHRVQEAQTTVYHALWELTQRAL